MGLHIIELYYGNVKYHLMHVTVVLYIVKNGGPCGKDDVELCAGSCGVPVHSSADQFSCGL